MRTTLMRTALLAAAVATTGLALDPAGLRAQSSDAGQHGLTGPQTTTSDIAGGAFSAEVHASAVPAAYRAALRAATDGVARRLRGGSMADAEGRVLPADVQRAVLDALSGDRAALAAVVAGLGVGEQESLRTSLHRILAAPDPQRLAEAVVAFNRVVETADAEYLAAPPPEFRTVHAVFAALIQAFRAGDGQGREARPAPGTGPFRAGG